MTAITASQSKKEMKKAIMKKDEEHKLEVNAIEAKITQERLGAQKDKNRLDALKKKYNKEVLLPPNVIPVGKKNYKFTPDGGVILGAQAQNDEVTQSIVADLAAQSDQLIQDRIAQLSGQI